ncbi:ABC transporter permease [Microbispora sp. SCL1-1]|uniref:ABC transporter permease n=1 Tax=Microbispora TaxID=2005 RepID=UPI00115BFF31|nr:MULTISPECIES: ABC transporter permease [unclassified Microbispora]NJP29852.1 ABC transporter permease [Microbispora sp. CL1-1]TQS03851.1 ABC transporter permease [Microbispora sp. SCL1-1]
MKARTKSRPPVVAILSAVVLAAVAVCAAGRELLAPHALDQDVYLGVVGAGVEGHLFGTDQLGRDILQLSLAGARSALAGPIVVAVGSMVIGVLLGTFAGYRGGVVDMLAGRYADLLLALPSVLLAIVVAGLVGRGYWITVAVLIVLFSPSDVRLVRGAVMEQTPRPYIESARILGIRPMRIMFRHIAPNIVPIVVANLLLNVAFALVALSSLSYLGLGVPPGAPDWGRQLADGRALLGDNPLAAVVPGVLIILTATAVNLLGDWLSELLDRRVVAR